MTNHAWTGRRTLAGLGFLLAITILRPDGAGAEPRGKVLPRPVDGAAALSLPPVGTTTVGRPDGAICKPKKNQLTYHGGPLVRNPDVFLLFWGSAWTSDAAHISAKANLENLHSKLVDSEYACAWREYSVPGYDLGAGTYAGSYVIASDPPNPVTDSQIQAKIQSEVGLGHAPARTDDTVYVMVTPSGTPVDDGSGATGCGGSNFQFCAYHSAFHSGGSFRYEVLPFPCSSGGGTCFVDAGHNVDNAFDTSASHELTELVTDPDSPAGWYSDRDGQENADICASDSCIYDVTIGGDTFATNSTWSNLAKGCMGTLSCGASPIGCTDPAPGLCSAGAGKTGACALEWQVDPNLTQKKGIATGKVSCTDGLPFCDADGSEDGTCTFHVAACMNNSDPRLGSCALQPIQAVEIRTPGLGDPLVPALLSGLSTADGAAPGTVSGARVDFGVPASTADSCTGYLDFKVPSGTTKKVSAAVTMGAGRAASKLKLTCR